MPYHHSMPDLPARTLLLAALLLFLTGAGAEPLVHAWSGHDPVAAVPDEPGATGAPGGETHGPEDHECVACKVQRWYASSYHTLSVQEAGRESAPAATAAASRTPAPHRTTRSRAPPPFA
jgi:hypothetical protein